MKRYGNAVGVGLGEWGRDIVILFISSNDALWALILMLV